MLEVENCVFLNNNDEKLIDMKILSKKIKEEKTIDIEVFNQLLKQNLRPSQNPTEFSSKEEEEKWAKTLREEKEREERLEKIGIKPIRECEFKIATANFNC